MREGFEWRRVKGRKQRKGELGGGGRDEVRKTGERECLNNNLYLKGNLREI